jgi:hypothetical protein
MANAIITPEFRVSFPNVFKPQMPMNGAAGDPKYGLSMLFKKGEDLSALKALANEACVEKFGADKTKWPKNLRNPFRDQGEKDLDGYEEGAIFCTATGRLKPGLVNARNDDIIGEDEFYPGCYARAQITAFAYDTTGNRGVAFGLHNIQKLRDGEALGGRQSASAVFGAVDTPDSADGLLD